MTRNLARSTPAPIGQVVTAARLAMRTPSLMRHRLIPVNLPRKPVTHHAFGSGLGPQQALTPLVLQ